MQVFFYCQRNAISSTARTPVIHCTEKFIISIMRYVKLRSKRLGKHGFQLILFVSLSCITFAHRQNFCQTCDKGLFVSYVQSQPKLLTDMFSKDYYCCFNTVHSVSKPTDQTSFECLLKRPNNVTSV